MEIYFKDTKLEKIFETQKSFVKKYGATHYKKWDRLRAEILAGETLHESFWPPKSRPHRCHELVGNLKGVLSFDLEHPYRLLAVPYHDPIPRLPDGGMDWSQITEIMIIGVENTHG